MEELAGKTIVAKIGSSTLCTPDGNIDTEFIGDLCNQLADLHDAGAKVVLVSSGASAAGMKRLGFTRRPTNIPQLQACASAGQALLTELYAQHLGTRGIACGQVLLTRSDVMSRASYLNARNTLETLLTLGAIPVVNENDVVSHTEFSFGDNDMLGALVSTMLNTSLYIILSDIDGLYTANPQLDPTATLIERVEHIDQHILDIAGGSTSSVGTGGMQSKVRAARACMSCGIPMVVCRGRAERALVEASYLRGAHTLFVPYATGAVEPSRKLWLGLAVGAAGSIVIDEGAVRALKKSGSSLLPAGVTGVRGTFDAGDVVNVIDERGTLIGRGQVRYSSSEAVQCRGLKLDIIERFLPERAGQPIIHRDDLLVL